MRRMFANGRQAATAADAVISAACALAGCMKADRPKINIHRLCRWMFIVSKIFLLRGRVTGLRLVATGR